MIEPTLLTSGYYRVQLSPQCWAQWPREEPLKREHIFNPEWNETSVMRWYEDWKRSRGDGERS
jgi:hypothetical protein